MVQRSNAARFVALGCLLCTWVTLLWILAGTFLSYHRAERSKTQLSQPTALQNCTRHWRSRKSCPSSGFVLQGGECVPCPVGKFSLPGWITCQPLLDCHQIEVETTRNDRLLHSVGNWNHYKADWSGYDVVYTILNPNVESVVDNDIFRIFSSHPNFFRPIGFCRTQNAVVFSYDPSILRTGDRLEAALASQPHCDGCLVRLRLAKSYLQVLSQLHANRKTLCNSNSLQQLLSQFLVRDDFTMVLASLDNLPGDVNEEEQILCHKAELTGDFVAPEQRWPHGKTKIFNIDEQPKYGTETDIWKAPDVVSQILGSGCSDELDYFRVIHWKCKSFVPGRRPTAIELLLEYTTVIDLLLQADLSK